MLRGRIWHVWAPNEYPYRVFFPAGVLGILYGMIRMVLPLSPENIYWHREAMIGLFLLPAAVGFVFTAGPRFFASTPARNGEVLAALVIILAMFAASLFSLAVAYTILKGMLLVLLFGFILSRFLRRQSGIPVFAPFLLLGPLSGILGCVSQWRGLYDPAPLWQELARSLYFHGMFWILFFGVGTKFFPVVTMTTRSRIMSRYSRFVVSSHLLWLMMAFTLLGTFVAEGLGAIRVAMIVRAFVILFLAKEGWLLFLKSPRRGVFTFFLKLGLWTALIAHFVFPVFPEQRVHFYHAIFAGGFLLGALIVMGRVSLAHESLDLNAEVKSRVAAVAFGLIYLALWTRVSAHLTQSYRLHLVSASLLVILAVLLLAGLYARLWYLGRRSKLPTSPAGGE